METSIRTNTFAVKMRSLRKRLRGWFYNTALPILIGTDRIENDLTKALPWIVRKAFWPILAIVDTVLELIYQLFFHPRYKRPRYKSKWESVKRSAKEFVAHSFIGFNAMAFGLSLAYTGRISDLMWGAKELMAWLQIPDATIPLETRLIAGVVLYVFFYPQRLDQSLFALRRPGVDDIHRAIGGGLGIYVIATFSMITVLVMQLLVQLLRQL